MAPGDGYARTVDALHAAGARVFERGGSARASGLCHESRPTSLTLSVRRGERGALIRCWRGCELDAVLDALGLQRRDLFDGDPPEGYTPPARRVLTPWERMLEGAGVRSSVPFEHVLDRIAQQAALEASPTYLLRRARECEAAAAVRASDFPGRQATAADRLDRRRRLLAAADEYRRRALTLKEGSHQ